MRYQPGSVRLVVLILPTLIALIGCSSKMSDKDRQNIATAYSEMLIAKNMLRTDSLAEFRAADSVVKHYGFANEGELMKKIKDLTNDPESLRMMFDSAQRRLERVQQGINPDMPGSAAAPQKKR